MTSSGADANGASADGHRPGAAYAGLVTRILGFAVDAAIIDVVAAVVAVIGGLTLSVLHAGNHVVAAAVAVAGVLYVLWSVGYFTLFWSTTGQTPGSRVMGIRVVLAEGAGRIKPRRALVRFAGMVLAAIPLGAGFLRILFDDRRRGFHDRLAGTVVLYVPVVRRASSGPWRPPAAGAPDVVQTPSLAGPGA